MNTLITIKVVSDSQTVKVLDAIEDGFAEFDRIVKQYTRFNENSELSNLNRQSGKWVEVSKEFFNLVRLMLELSNKSDGAFDPTIIDFLDIYGYNKDYDFSKLDNPELNAIVSKRVDIRPSWSEIELDEKSCKIKLANDQRIDLGGIGKGYAIDCAFDVIKNEYSLKNFLIDAGGDIRASGRNSQDLPWRVGLKHQNDQEEEVIHSTLDLENAAIACSGSWARKVKQFHHLINPANGLPHDDFKTVYVLAKNATLADGWATAIFILGKDVKKYDLEKEGIKYFLL